MPTPAPVRRTDLSTGDVAERWRDKDASRRRTDSISNLARLSNSNQRRRAGVGGEELRIRNEDASSCIRPCVARSSHFYRAKFIPQSFVNRRSIVFTDSAMMLDLFETEMGKVTYSISYSEQPQWLPLYAQLFRHPPRKWQAAAV